MGGVADGWAAHSSQPTHLPSHPSEKPFKLVINSRMPFTQDIKILSVLIMLKDTVNDCDSTTVALRGLINGLLPDIMFPDFMCDTVMN